MQKWEDKANETFVCCIIVTISSAWRCIFTSLIVRISSTSTVCYLVFVKSTFDYLSLVRRVLRIIRQKKWLTCTSDSRVKATIWWSVLLVSRMQMISIHWPYPQFVCSCSDWEIPVRDNLSRRTHLEVQSSIEWGNSNTMVDHSRCSTNVGSTQNDRRV